MPEIIGGKRDWGLIKEKKTLAVYFPISSTLVPGNPSPIYGMWGATCEDHSTTTYLLKVRDISWFFMTTFNNVLRTEKVIYKAKNSRENFQMKVITKYLSSSVSDHLWFSTYLCVFMRREFHVLEWIKHIVSNKYYGIHGGRCSPTCLYMRFSSYITVTSWWARWRLKPPAWLLFTPPFIKAQIKKHPRAKASNAEMFPFDDVIIFPAYSSF